MTLQASRDKKWPEADVGGRKADPRDKNKQVGG
jgi:hypothetical protein